MVTLPLRFRNASLDDFPADCAKPGRDFVERILALPANHEETRHDVGLGHYPTGNLVRDLRGVDGLVIVGPTGVGKTHFIAGIANALDGQEDLLFRSALAIVDEAKAEVGTGREFRDYARCAGVLMVDDLSGIRPTDFAVDTLARIIRIRYDDALPTVVTTHSKHRALAELYGAAIASRLLEFGPVVRLEGEDRRQAALEQAVS